MFAGESHPQVVIIKSQHLGDAQEEEEEGMMTAEETPRGETADASSTHTYPSDVSASPAATTADASNADSSGAGSAFPEVVETPRIGDSEVETPRGGDGGACDPSPGGGPVAEPSPSSGRPSIAQMLKDRAQAAQQTSLVVAVRTRPVLVEAGPSLCIF